MSLWQIAVDAPLPPLTYLAPDSFNLEPGQSVLVPLKNRKVSGLVLNSTTIELVDKTKNTKIKAKEILDILPYPTFPISFIKWIQWLSQYYFYNIGSMMNMIFPPLKNKDGRSRKGSLTLYNTDLSPHSLFNLNQEQTVCVDNILKTKDFHAHLLFGVTGSGKTEVYLQLLEEVLKNNNQGLVLVPEISLTPQLIQRFAKRFGQNIAVIHSHLTPRERTNQWWSIVEGKKNILIGVRSALFCPIPRLGLIIVDEEHETSFKQEEKLKYHARDAAVMRAHLTNCQIVLGSATPSAETWYNAKTMKYSLHYMKQRVENRPLPKIEVIDLRADRLEAKTSHEQSKLQLPFWLSKTLYQALKQNIDRQEQSALFINRRGVAQSVFCRSCGHIKICPNCDVTLTLHGKSHLVCHYCNYHENFSEVCSDCKQDKMFALGLGTELIETDVKRLFPNARLARADRDEIDSREDMEALITKMEQEELDIIIGTQMIAKGLDFQKLTLVGLVLADIGFNIPDFRSTERSFQLITQMGGRSGRHASKGIVLLQTYNPSHISIVYSKKNDFEGFINQELEKRQMLHYPPFGKLLSIRLEGPNDKITSQWSKKIASSIESFIQDSNIIHICTLLGPTPAAIYKLHNRYRHYLLLKSKDNSCIEAIGRFLIGLTENYLPSTIKLIIDRDPVHLL